MPNTIIGWNVVLLTICPARDSSTKPMSDASDVPLTTWTRKPTVGGMLIRAACGRMMVNIACIGRNPSARRGLNLACRDRHDATGPDLAEIGGRVNDKTNGGGQHGADLKAEHRPAEEDDEDLDQQRSPLINANERQRQPLHDQVGRHAGESHGKAQHAAARECNERENDGPFPRPHDVEEVACAELVQHQTRSG